VYGPVRTVVWQGSAGNRRPYADQVDISESGTKTIPFRHSSFRNAPGSWFGSEPSKRMKACEAKGVGTVGGAYAYFGNRTMS